MTKTITISEIESILQKHFKPPKYRYNFSFYNTQQNWFVVSFGTNYKNNYGRYYMKDCCYCMALDDEYKFTQVMRGLSKQLLGYKIIDIENINKDLFLRS